MIQKCADATFEPMRQLNERCSTLMSRQVAGNMPTRALQRPLSAVSPLVKEQSESQLLRITIDVNWSNRCCLLLLRKLKKIDDEQRHSGWAR